MVDLATAGLIAKLTSDAVGAFDKIFRGYADFLRGKKPSASNIPPPDFAYVDAPTQNAFVAKSRRTGEVYQTVTYEELGDKLNDIDYESIEALSRAMKNYQRQWNTVVEQKSMASGIEIGRLESQQEFLAKKISETLLEVLSFVEGMGLFLDDHYHMSRNIAEKYAKNLRTAP